jgi:two-component system, cell cycle response regulator
MKVLIAEDDPVSRKVLEKTLASWDYDVVVTQNGEQAWQVLQGEDAPSLVILDWMMPDLDGVDVCRRLRDLPSSSPPYVILLSARDSKDDIVLGLNAGANDYVGKPFDRHELRARLEVGRRFVELNDKLVETQRRLEIQARTDLLTGLMNRRAVLERLHDEMARAERNGSMVGVGLLDIDHFKLVNDSYGHAVGDEVLRQLGVRSVTAMRAYDAFGRFGGEEFLAILPDSDGNQTKTVLERVKRAVSRSPMKAEGHEVHVTVSIGGAASAGGSVDALLHLADDVLYLAKSSGRNRVVMAEPGEGGVCRPTVGAGARE